MASDAPQVPRAVGESEDHNKLLNPFDNDVGNETGAGCPGTGSDDGLRG